jgi:hypothetical protein
MILLNKEYLRFLNSNFQLSEIKKNTFDNFSTYFDFLINSNNIPLDYDKYLTSFPYYPKDFKYFKSLKLSNSVSFSTQKIVDSIPVDNVYLQKSNFKDIIIPINSLIEKIPDHINNITFSHLTQKIILDNNFLDNYIYDLHINSVPNNYNNIYDLLITEPFQNIDSSINNINLLNLISLYNIFYKLFIDYYNFSQPFYTYCIAHNSQDSIFTNNYMKTEFNTFLLNTNNYFDNSVYINLSKLILKNNFNLISPVDSIVSAVQTFIESTQLTKLSDCFLQFLNLTQSNSLVSILKNNLLKGQNIIFYNIFNELLSENINNFLSEDYLNNNTNLNTILNQDYLNNIIQNVNEFKLKHYLLPIYQYSNKPIKFINVITQFIQEFIKTDLMNDINYNKLINQVECENLINRFLNNLQEYSNIKSFFDNINIREIYNNNQIGSIISLIFYKDIINEFVEHDLFNNYIIEMLTDLNSFLYSEKLIQYNYNWFNNIELIKAFFKTFFLKYIYYYNEDDSTYYNYLYPTLNYELDEFFNNTTFTFEGSSEQINININSLLNNKNLLDNIYYLTKNIFTSVLNKLLYQKILNYYLND